MKEIKYIEGDVTNPIGEGNKILCHCCNDLVPGIMGAGVALALRKKWASVYEKYSEWSIGRSLVPYELGEVLYVKVEPKIVVANMIGQHGIGFVDDIPPIRYEAMDSCFKKVAVIAKKYDASIHMPYLIGCALAGGDWKKMEGLIIENLCKNDVEVVIYDFNKLRSNNERQH